MDELLQEGDIFATTHLKPPGAEWLVISARMSGGTGGPMSHDFYPDGWYVKAQQLGINSEPDPEGDRAEFYQSAEFLGSILPTDIQLLGRLNKVVTWVAEPPRKAAANTVPTFTASIPVGFRVGRSGQPATRVHSIDEAMEVCQAYCDEVGLCVTVTPTTFIYTKGREPGVLVGLINYPRFPSTPEKIREHATALAERLRAGLEQWKVCIVCPDETVMLGNEPATSKES